MDTNQAPHAAAASLKIQTGLDWTRIAWIVGLLWLAYLVALPVGYLIFSSVFGDGFTFKYITEFFNSPKRLRAAANSLLVALGVAVLSVLIGAPLALGVARTRMRFKTLVRATMVISLVTPEFLLALAYITLAGPNAGFFNQFIRQGLGIGEGPGPLNIFSIWGLIFTALPHGVSFVFLTLVPALKNIDPALDEAARVQGATAMRAIWRILIPLMRPALLSGALLAFAGSLAMYGPPHMLGLNVLTMSIRESLLDLDFEAAAVSSIILTVISVVALAGYRASTRQAERFQTLSGKSFSVRPIELGHVTHLLSALALIYSLIALLVPYGGMLMVSLMRSVGFGITTTNWTLSNYAGVLSDVVIRDAIWRSVCLASLSASLVVVMGVVVAYALVRGKGSGRALLDYLSILPLALPGVALAIALVVIYLSPPFNILGFYGSFSILLVAYLARYVTFGVRTSQIALLQISRELEEAARVAGAGQLRTILRITVPLIREGLIYAWIIVFILALPELGSSIILQGIHTQVISTALLNMWSGSGGLTLACAFGMLIFFAVGVLLLAANEIARRADIRGAMRFS